MRAPFFKMATKAISGLASVGLAAMGIVAIAPSASAATAVVNSITFKAPVHTSYDHATGGGAFNDGSVTYSKGELLGTNYKCGDYASFVFELTLSGAPTMAAKGNGKYDTIVVLDYTTDATGQSGVGLQPDITAAHLKVNSGVIAAPGSGTGTSGSDGGFAPAGSGMTTAASVTNASQVQNGTFFTSGSTNRITFTVTDLAPASTTIVRSDAKIMCKAGMNPTGNMQASLISATATNGSATEAVSAGNQTVNFRGVGDIMGASAPMLTMTKSISSNGTDCTTTVSTRSFVSSPASVMYCYSVTNNGTQPATNVRLLDDNATPGNTSDDFYVTLTYTYNSVTSSSTGTPLTIASLPGGGTVATGTRTVTYGADGTYTNIATTSSGNHASLTKSATAVVGTAPNLNIVKTQTSGSPTAVGQTITYSIVATNNGAVTIDNVNLTDANATLGSCSPALPVASLAVNATITCSATHVVTNADVLAGAVTNTAAGSFAYNSVTSNRSSNTVSTPLSAAMTVVKTDTTSTAPTAAGDIVTYSIVVTNSGSLTLSAVNLTDANATIGSCSPALPVASLAAGATITCSASHTVTSAEVTAGSIANVAIASTTTGPIANVNSNTVNTSVTPPAPAPAPQNNANPNLGITKSLKGNAPKKVGDPVVYKVVVTNTGNVNLNDLKIEDIDGNTLVCPPNANALAVGASLECEVTHVVTQEDMNAGKIVRDAAAKSNGNALAKTSNEVVVPLAQTDSLGVKQKKIDGDPKKPGDKITYEIVITNDGNVSLEDVILDNPEVNIKSCTPALPVAKLNPGETITCTADYAVTATDIANGFVANFSIARSKNYSAQSTTGNEVETPIAVKAALAETGDEALPVFAFSALLLILGAWVAAPRKARA